MLTLPEKILFALAVIATLYVTWKVISRIIATIARGHGKPDWALARRRLVSVLAKTLTLQPTFKIRLLPSIFHTLVAWGFIYYLLVNIGDVLQGFIPDFRFLGSGLLGGMYRFGADLLSVAILVGMIALLIRRFLIRPANLSARDHILLHPKARASIRRDSAIVGGFILLHVGGRFLGDSVQVALHQGTDPWRPFASAVASLLSGADESLLAVTEHVFFWLALGSIMLFIPYFLFSKHLHLFVAPLNFLLKPERPSIGALEKLDFDDESIEQFGASHLEDLGWEQIMDAYACIQCFRCQEVCPAYNTGKVLSPAAMEINKRYYLNDEGGRFAAGEESPPLVEFAIPPEAIWACTACGACVDICPTNNEPMRDILNIRQSLVLMENQFPNQLQTAFRGMERTANPWNIGPSERMKWAEGLNVPTVEDNPEPELLWWVGCAPSTDARAQKTARAFAEILNASGINYAVLGEMEQCTGDSARRAGNEFLFNELATMNVETLNEVAPKRIVTTCPHCLHTIQNEYPAFGGSYQVIHHTQLINELAAENRLALNDGASRKTTYHDPCYLGRMNEILKAPRQVLEQNSNDFVEMSRRGKQSFCCGAGGSQMWKEEEDGVERVSANRMKEAIDTGAEQLAVGCPFCMIMLTDAAKGMNAELEVIDIAEIVARQLIVKEEESPRTDTKSETDGEMQRSEVDQE